MKKKPLSPILQRIENKCKAAHKQLNYNSQLVIKKGFRLIVNIDEYKIGSLK